MTINAPEFASVEAFAEYMLDDDRTTFGIGEAAAVAKATGRSNLGVVAELQAYGFTFTPPRCVSEPRGYRSNNHTRWVGNPGAGGGGGDSLTGFAGREG